ncbi:hypothetical protein C7N43_36870 [Sphingobacteriales bacterium UPWRP_1]|nr:hypothetical protein B6N25_00495 [Sphingobacteriales bacterium TSM_CSS]PSJ71924.1 hypothetical protein C7N43_36870 [Sphingobacteriales bacterium UPWRP_1]
MHTIEIPLSKSKIALRAGGSVLFVLLGYYLFTTLSAGQSAAWAAFVKGVGAAAMLFFTITALYGVKKLFDKNIGLTIDAQGITDNTHASSIGLIKWQDITDIKTAQIMSNRFLLIYTQNPHAILEKYSGIRRKLMEQNMKMYGTPVTITADTLQYPFDELEKLLAESLHQARNRTTPQQP